MNSIVLSQESDILTPINALYMYKKQTRDMPS